MRRRALGVLIVAVLVLGGALAGCGGGDHEANVYVEAVNRAQNRLASTFARLSRRVTATSTPGQDRRTLAAYRDAVDRVVGELREIHAPAAVKVEHRRLATDIGGYGTEIDRARAAFSSSDPHRILAARTELVSGVSRVSARINRTIKAINHKLGV